MFTHRIESEIEWGQCDPAGIVFFPRYFEMFDAAAAQLFAAALGASKRGWLEAHGIVGIPVVEIEASFLAPCRFGDRVSIDSEILGIGRSSIDVGHRLGGPAGIAVEARIKRVWTGRDGAGSEKLRGVAVPDAVRRALGG